MKTEEGKSEIEQFISDYDTMRVDVSPGVSYSLTDINNNSYRMLNAKFLQGEFEGDFQNIKTRKSFVILRTMVQGADVDTKDVKVGCQTQRRQFVVDLLKMVFHSHFQRTFFGEFIDKVKEEMCWFGSSIAKRFDGTVDTVDLRNYITEPNVQEPQERRHLELCFYTYEQMLANKEVWDNWDMVEEAWEVMKKNGVSQFRVLDFWTWDKMDGKVHKVCKRYLDRSDSKPDDFQDASDWVPFVQLETFKTPYKIKTVGKREKKLYGKEREMFPYEQFDLFRIPGRSIGLGLAELLSMPELMYDQLFNLKRKADLKALFGVYVHTAIQSIDGLSEIDQETLSSLDKGTVVSLAPGETLEPMRFDTRSGDFQIMEEKIYELMLQLAGITAQGTGQTVAATTSATQIMDNRMVENKVYEYVKERMHHGLVRLMRNGYADDIIDDLSEESLIEISGDVRMLEEIDTALIDNAINAWVKETHDTLGYYPMGEEVEMVRQQLTQDLRAMGGSRFPEIKKELFKNMNVYLDWNIVDESIDYKQRMETLNAMKNDPTSTKSKAKIEDALISDAGLNPRQFDKSAEELAQEEQAMMQQQMQTAPAVA